MPTRFKFTTNALRRFEMVEKLMADQAHKRNDSEGEDWHREDARKARALLDEMLNRKA